MSAESTKDLITKILRQAAGLNDGSKAFSHFIADAMTSLGLDPDERSELLEGAFRAAMINIEGRW